MAAAKEYIEEEEYEMLLSVETDTVVDPRTVMIHPSDATFADRTVMRMRRLY